METTNTTAEPTTQQARENLTPAQAREYVDGLDMHELATLAAAVGRSL